MKIGFHSGQANIHKVELTIPNVLPSRLTTLQKACLAATFESNPAACPPQSDVATVIAHSPSSGRVERPRLPGQPRRRGLPRPGLVLQGDNVKLDVVGHTDIKGGITYSRFESRTPPSRASKPRSPRGPHFVDGECPGKAALQPVWSEHPGADDDRRPERSAMNQTTNVAIKVRLP